MKRAAKNALLDKMHRGVVYTCLGMTAYGGYLLSLRVYNYFTVVKPANRAYELELLKKGDHSIAPAAADIAKSVDTARQLNA